MTWFDFICRIGIPALLGWLAIWAGITRIPWHPPSGDDK